MKKLIFLVLILFCTIAGNAQVSCGTDTTGYTGRLKTLFGTTNHLIDRDTIGWGMGFHAGSFLLPQDITLYGFKFFAYVANSPRSAIRARLYTSNNGFPGTLLATKTVQINTDTILNEHTVIFNNPQTISDTFFLTIEKLTPHEFVIETSNGISVVPRFGVYEQSDGWHNVESELGVINEPNIYPIVGYDVYSGFTVDGLTVSQGDTIDANTCQTLSFQHSGSPILRNFMFRYRFIHTGNPVLWKFGDGSTGNDLINPETHSYRNPGVYRAILIDTVEGYDNTIHCVDSFYVYINVTGVSCKTSFITGVGEISEDSFIIYPNPSEGIFYVEGEIKGFEIMVRDLIGRVVYREEARYDKVKIDLSWQNRGVYIVSLLSRNKIVNKRISIK